MKRQYVLIWCRKGNDNNKTLLILKDRPAWQAGRLNLPGGKIEEGESPEQAACRELMEETSYECATEPRIMGKLVGKNYVIWILKTVVISDNEPQGREGETEVAKWFKWSDALMDNRLIPNLKLIIPLVMSGVEGFIVSDLFELRDANRHVLKISVLDQS